MSEERNQDRRRPLLLPQLAPPEGASYAALAPFGASYDSSMRDIHRSGLNAQRSGELTRERRKAWQELRNSEKRLALDLFHLQPDPAVFGEEGCEVPEMVVPEAPSLNLPPTPPPKAAAIAAALGDVPLPRAPEPIDPGPPPPLTPDMWALLEEVWGRRVPEPGPPPEPFSFLEEET